ncbi:DNA cytosine methyltransferase [Parafrigoribacterium humi]|uniref:DNA cytosine methyltransferase n=1 Tax=Parafrigoribacterium humi TaxID=3144664 RepID=UPI0032EFC446
MKSELTAIDLFAGAGGLSEGLRQAGFSSLYANEIVPTYARTYEVNHGNTVVDSEDIRTVNAADVRKRLGLKRGELDLVAGGPPCQGFSINAPVRSNEDHRNHLFREYLRFVEEFNPRAVLIENVPGLVSFANGGTLEAIIASLKALGYSADVQILYAPHYGVPQTRWRTIIIGMKDGSDPLRAFPVAERMAPMRINFTSKFGGRAIVAMPRSVELPPHTTVADAIGDLPPLLNGQAGLEVKEYLTSPQNSYQQVLRAGSDGVRNHEAPKLSSINMERLKYIRPGGNWTDIPYELLPKGMQAARRSDHTKRYGRVAANGLASTILTKCDPHWGAYFHYSQDRAFTIREAARIQSFPDSFVFTGSKVDQYEQVGNAVPPLLAAAVGQSISAALGVRRAALKRVV